MYVSINHKGLEWIEVVDRVQLYNTEADNVPFVGGLCPLGCSCYVFVRVGKYELVEYDKIHIAPEKKVPYHLSFGIRSLTYIPSNIYISGHVSGMIPKQW